MISIHHFKQSKNHENLNIRGLLIKCIYYEKKQKKKSPNLVGITRGVSCLYDFYTLILA